MRELFARIAGRCVERPAPVLAAVVLLALVGAVGALKLEADAGVDQLVDEDSATFAATEEFKQDFGDDAVVVLVRGDLEQLVLTENLGTLLSLEGCLSGNATAAEGAEIPGAVRRARRDEAGAGGLRARDLPQPVRDPGGQAPQPAGEGGRAPVAAGRRAGGARGASQRPQPGRGRGCGADRGPEA